MPSDRSPLRWSALDRVLAHPRFVWVVVLVALVLGLPSLGNGLIADDLAHRLLITSQHAGRSDAPWWDLFVLVEHDPQRTIGMRTSGRFPWWVDPELRIAFFRPLSALTHHLDYWLWPDTPWLMHLHSLAWHAACCAAAWLVARRVVSSPRVAGLAALVYALSFTHVVPCSWLAHRNGLVSCFWGLAALLAHLHWRQDAKRWAAFVGPACLALALLGAEAGVVTLAFLVAYELVLADDAGRKRLAALIPALLVLTAWRLVYDALGYGAQASGGYIDPIAEPLGFVSVLPQRLATLLGLSVGPPFVPGRVSSLLWAGGALAVGGAVLVFVARASRRAGAARFGLLATGLACLPLAASFPVDRVLIFAGLGLSLALAELIDAWVLRPSGVLATGFGSLAACCHLLVPIPLGLYMSSHLEHVVSNETDAFAPTLDNDELGRQGLVILHTPHYPAADQLALNRVVRGLSAPNFVWVLHTGPEQPAFRCTGERTIAVHAEQLGWPAGGFGAQFRSTRSRPFTVGESVRTLDYTATVLEVDDGQASVVAFEFRAPLDHPSFAWVTWEGEDFQAVDPREQCSASVLSEASLKP